MKYSILINQVGIAKAGLLDKTDIIDWAIVDYLKDWFFSEKRKTIFNADEGEYYVWLNLNHLLENMPLLRLNKSALSERLKKLKSLGLIKTFQTKDNSLYFVLTPLCVDLMFHREPVASVQYPVRLDEQGVRQDEQGVRQDEQGVRQDEQGVRLDEQGVRQDEQGVRWTNRVFARTNRVFARTNSTSLLSVSLISVSLISVIISVI
jgi:hypothetical protein